MLCWKNSVSKYYYDLILIGLCLKVGGCKAIAGYGTFAIITKTNNTAKGASRLSVNGLSIEIFAHHNRFRYDVGG